MSILETALVERRIIKHAMIDGVHRTKLPEYKIYVGMVARCKNPNVPGFHRYGGRGIKVCDRWVEDFKHFYDDMGPRPSAKHSIDRIDNDGNYEPGNCRWATTLEQARNRPLGKAASRDNPYYWTEEEEAIIKRMFAHHANYADIALAVGRSEATIRLRCFKLGLRRDASTTRLCRKYPHLKPVLQERGVDAFLVALKDHVEAVKDAESARREAETTGRQQIIADILGRQIPRNDKLRALRLAGLNLAEIGALVGLTRERVRQLQLKDFRDSLGGGRKPYKSKNVVRHTDRLVRAWNSASQEARIAFLDIATDTTAKLPQPVATVHKPDREAA